MRFLQIKHNHSKGHFRSGDTIGDSGKAATRIGVRICFDEELVAGVTVWCIVAMIPERNLDNPAHQEENRDCESADGTEVYEEEESGIDNRMNETEKWEDS